ncbi:MAG: hypothetical protein ACQETH_16445 [Candidatus Rifleibacteriota bacterium]
MRAEGFEQAIKDFLLQPSPQTAIALIKSCKSFVIRQAVEWKNCQLSMQEKFQELMAEMFLILLEDFKPEQIKQPASALSYLKLKLRRLTRVSKNKPVAFAFADEKPDSGRINFTPLRLELTDEIVKTIRQTLANQTKEKTGLLEFLFIHIYPEIAWASRLLAEAYKQSPEKRHAADKKRHQKFNLELQNGFKNLKNGNWQDIRDWSCGERSHLAWRIIDISSNETGLELNHELEKLSHFRENFSKKSQFSISQLEPAEKIFTALQNTWSSGAQKIAAEPAAPYGESPDLIAMLVSRQLPVPFAKESEKFYTTSPKSPQPDQKLLDQNYINASEQIISWLNTILNNK